MSTIADAAAAFLAALLAAPVDGDDDAARVDEVAVLERVKGAVAARQARVTDAFTRSQQAELAAVGVAPPR